MDLQWSIFVQRVGTDESIAVGTVERPVKGATVADFDLSISDLTLTVPGHMDPVLARRGCISG